MDKKNKKKHNNRKNNSPVSTIHSHLIYGISPVLEALNAESRKIEKILIADGKKHYRINEIIDSARRQNIKFQKVSQMNFTDFLPQNTNHQGVIAFTSSENYYDSDKLFKEIVNKKNSLSIILDGVEDPHNLGAILRSVECVGADGVFIPERRAVGLTDTVTKTSAGASEYVKVAKVTNVNRLIEDLKQQNVWIVGASGDAEMDYTDWDWKQKTALVMGGEGKGLSRLTAEKCDVLVRIPLFGKIESLNVSVATGVLLFEAVRQRKQK